MEILKDTIAFVSIVLMIYTIILIGNTYTPIYTV